MPEKFEPKFFKPSPAAPEQKPEFKEKPIDRLQNFIERVATELKESGIPVDKKGRLDMNQFKEVYPRRIIEADKNWVKDLRERWDRAAVSGSSMSWILSREQILKQKTVGEAWEMLATAVLHKNLGKDFIVVRVSEYDDDRNGVDNVMVEKKSGNLVCAFDEVGATSGPRFNEKRKNILERNWRHGGADIAYGISIKDGKLKKGRINHIPLFYFASPEEAVRRGVETFSPHSSSPEEQRIFKSFLESFNGQIKEIRSGPLHPKFEQRLDFFDAILGKLKDVVK